MAFIPLSTHHGVDSSSVAFLGPLVENLLVQTLRQPLFSSSSNDNYSPAVIVADADRQEETQDIGHLEKQPRGSPVRGFTSTPETIRIDTEAGRIDPRRSERVSEVYSPSILNLVRGLVTPTSTSSGPPCPRGQLVRADIP